MRGRFYQAPTALLLAAISAVSASPAWATDCDTTCSDFKKSMVSSSPYDARHPENFRMSMAYVVNNCGAPQGTTQATTPGATSIFQGDNGQTGTSAAQGASLSSQTIDPNYTTGTSWDTCFTALKERWNQVGPNCMAMDLYGSAIPEELATAIIYGVAAASCWVACYYPAWSAGCSAGSFVAAAADLAGEIIIDAEGTRLNAVSWVAGAAGQVGGAAAGATAAAGAAGDGLNIGGTASERANACIAAGTLTVVTGLKFWAYAMQKNDQNANCQNIINAGYQGPFVQPGTTANPSPSPSASAGGSNSSGSVAGGGSGSSGSGGSTGSAGSIGPSQYFGENQPFPPPQYAAATAGDIFGTTLATNPDLGQIPAQLAAAGINTQALAKGIASGQGLGSLLGGLDGLGGISSQIDQLQKDAEAGKDKILKDGKPMSMGSYTSGGGGGKGAAPAAKPNPFGMLGMKGPGFGGDAPKETTFDKAKRELASSDANGDIWHEGFGGSIFQIVSQKLDKTRERVEQLEWDTPLNRALLGLPARKPGTK